MTSMQTTKKGVQVEKENYEKKEYLSVDRFVGLHKQFDLCMDCSSEDTFLEIGPGPGLLAGLLRHFGREVTTVDFAEDLSPDILAKLPDLPFEEDSFDVVCAFEVLEHMPFELFAESLDELHRVCRKKVIISVPSQKTIFEKEISFKIKFLKKKFEKTIWWKRSNEIANKNEHHWEIFDGNMTLDKIFSEINKTNLEVVDSFFVGPWFQFFVLKK